MDTTTPSATSVLWFSSVVVCGVMDVDITRMQSSGVGLGYNSFYWVYSLQSSSRVAVFDSLVDANGLEEAVKSRYWHAHH